MSVSDTAAALRSQGVQICFGVSGSGSSWQIATALEDIGVSYHGAAHEAAAAIMAGAHARQSGALGCSISIKGPGLANMAAGMLSNRYEQWPAVSLSEAYNPAVPSPRMHKRLDHRAVVAPIVKGYAAGNDARTIEGLARLAHSEIPGPVHLDFTESGGRIDCFETQSSRSGMQSKAWDEIRRRIDSARRPLLIAGSLATRSAWGSRLRDLGFPVFTTLAAKGVLDERLRMSAGVFTGDGKSLTPEAAIVAEADLIVGLGLRNLEVLTPRPFHAPLIGLDAAEDASLMDGFNPCANCSGAAAEHFDSILGALALKSWGGDIVASSVGRLRTHLTRHEWLPGRVFSVLQKLMNESDCLVMDTGAFCTVAEHVWQASSTTAFMASANGRFMGTAFPMAIGASLARSLSRTLCVFGDGGIRPFWAEIKLAIAERLPILFVLMSDGRYGSIAAAASTPHLTDAAINVPLPSWFRIAEAAGCPAEQVSSVDGLERIITAWQQTDGPCFVEAPFEPDAYAGMTRDIR